MKKVLYSTTALAAAGMFAFSGADAQAAEKVKLGVGGSFIWLAGVADNDSDDLADLGSINMVGDSEVNFRGNTTLDNGVRVALPGGRQVTELPDEDFRFFVPHPKDAYGTLFEFIGEDPDFHDPRRRPWWDASYWSDRHPLGVEGLSHSTVAVADLDGASRFYEDLLGCTLVHEDLPLVIRTLRELSGTEIERARVDSRSALRDVLKFTESFIPELSGRIEHYSGERPIFDLYGVEDEIRKALGRKVTLKSGGHLVIDQTEAMTTIDVNTGAYVGHRNLEETIFKTNLEATSAIARQLRLRNLGGIIIIDFIDMEDPEHRRQVLRSLQKTLERDHTRTHISEVSPLGLVQMTRKRTRESLEHQLCEPCPTCEGRGSIKTSDTVCYEIFREIVREARQYDAARMLVIASPEVVETLIDEESAAFGELETFIGRPITLQVEGLYAREQFDVVLM